MIPGSKLLSRKWAAADRAISVARYSSTEKHIHQHLEGIVAKLFLGSTKHRLLDVPVYVAEGIIASQMTWVWSSSVQSPS